MHGLILVPDPSFPSPFAWAFHGQAEALREAGIEVCARPWTRAGDLDCFDFVMPLVAWGYHLRSAEWLALLDRLEEECVPTLNPVRLLRWNSDKSYLADLTEKGIATVPTLAVEQLAESDLAMARQAFGEERLVVKPPVSANADRTYVLAPGDPLPDDVAGQRMLIQPWVRSITESGEYSLILFGGELSHCLSKKPRPGDFRVQPDFGGSHVPAAPLPGAIELAKAALDAAPCPAAYARVDMVEGNDGSLQIIELELIEPALFLDCDPESPARFARAVLLAAEGSAEQPLADC